MEMKKRTHDEVRELLAAVDSQLFYGLAVTAPLMVRELLIQLDELMSERAET